MFRKTRVLAMLAAALVWGAGGAAEAGCTLKYAPLSVSMENLKPLLDATVDGRKVRFVLDSGAFFSFITPGTAAALGLKSRPAPVGLTTEGLGGEFRSSIVTVQSLELAGVPLHHVDFLTGGSETGEGSAGVLGQNLLHSHDVEYDLSTGTIRLIKADGCTGVLGYWPSSTGYSVLKLTQFNNNGWATTVYVEINGHKLKAEFDTGAGLSYLTLAAARRLGFDPKAAGVVDDGVSMGFGARPFQTWIMPIDSFKIGDEEIKHTRLRVGDSAIGDIDMLIGPDFFLSHHILVANSRKQIVFSYNGGPVFDLRPADQAQGGAAADPPAPPPPAQTAAAGSTGAFASEPTDADGFARRGAAEADRGAYAAAVADLERAHRLDPKSAHDLDLLGMAHQRNGQARLAAADFDAALALDPDDVTAHIARAQVRLSTGDEVGARADADAAAKEMAAQDDRRRALADIYVGAGAWAEASQQDDLWIAAHPVDANRMFMLNERCWAGAMSGTDLDGALKACDAALRIAPKTAGFLDSRGLVHLRRGETAKAVADYDAALALDPNLPWSLYGRAIVEQRQGLTDKAKADFAAAAAGDPTVADRARSVGVRN